MSWTFALMLSDYFKNQLAHKTHTSRKSPEDITMISVQDFEIENKPTEVELSMRRAMTTNAPIKPSLARLLCSI